MRTDYAKSRSSYIKIPGRVLFDTNLVNVSLDFGDFICDGAALPDNIPSPLFDDLMALEAIFSRGKRAAWQLAISPITYGETANTRDDVRRRDLLGWFNELWLYWREIFERDGLSDAFADSLINLFVQSGDLSVLPDIADRCLIAHAIAYNCDAFCTRDHKTILRHRQKLENLPIRFLSPCEWWREIRPYEGLW
jgi:hypothetical protein